ncbi:MAG: hypothetical protein RL148_1446 [Planctomycetota bacterium]|jgi:molybdopterin synthase catalytic subunit
MVRVTLRCFASVREALGQDVVHLTVPRGTTVAGLREMLGQDHPALLRLALAWAVNQGYADGTRELADGDEVAFIPPISGGNTERFRFTLRREPLDVRALEAETRTDADGALVTFSGVTRNHNEGSAVESLSYEAYPEMAQRMMQTIFADADREHAITRARVEHRLGTVPVGEACVVVCVAAPHRKAAFAAAEYLMDRLKHEVPVFKREALRDGGGTRWVGSLPDPSPTS